LETDQIRLEQGTQGFSGLGFTDPGMSFDQERLSKFKKQKNCCRQRPVGYIPKQSESIYNIFYIANLFKHEGFSPWPASLTHPIATRRVAGRCKSRLIFAG